MPQAVEPAPRGESSPTRQVWSRLQVGGSRRDRGRKERGGSTRPREQQRRKERRQYRRRKLAGNAKKTAPAWRTHSAATLRNDITAASVRLFHSVNSASGSAVSGSGWKPGSVGSGCVRIKQQGGTSVDPLDVLRMPVVALVLDAF